MKFWCLIFSFLFISCGKPITEQKAPEILPLHQGVSEEILLETDMFNNFHLLPLKGSVNVTEKYWSGDSWKLSRGSINYRWNDPSADGKKYFSPSSREVMNMSENALSKLSPSEKYDLLMGNYNYPLKSEVEFYASTGTLDWEGLCHGWAVASSMHKEPSPRTVKNPDGIEIPFGSSDIKAILTYAYSKLILNNDQILGKRCDDKAFNDCDDDLTAVSFHIVTANKIGLRGQSYIADMDRFEEVWNHPVVAYESQVDSMRSSRTGKTARLTTKLTYVDLVPNNSWSPVPRVLSYMTLKYELDLNDDDNIVGGRWLGSARPDFLWGIKERPAFTNYFSGIQKLVE